MNNLEPTLDLNELVGQFQSKNNVTAAIKDRIKTLFVVPKTMEDLDAIINTVNQPVSIFPKVSLSSLDKQLQKARFYVNEADLDYV